MSEASFGKWVATSPLASVIKTFGAVLFAGAIAEFSADGTIDLSNWQTWVIAGLVSIMPTVVNWLNPLDPRYGRGSAK